MSVFLHLTYTRTSRHGTDIIQIKPLLSMAYVHAMVTIQAELEPFVIFQVSFSQHLIINIIRVFCINSVDNYWQVGYSQRQ